MKRNKASNRSIRFIQRNSPKNQKTKEYINTLANNAFGLKDYKFIHTEDNVVFQIYNIFLVLDEEFIELQLYEDNKKIASFLGDSCWYQGLKFIKENFNF